MIVRILFPPTVFCLLFSSILLQAAVNLEPREPFERSIFRSNKGSVDLFHQLKVNQTLSYDFSGEGEIVLSSRALLTGNEQAARYSLRLLVDGNPVPREFNYRTTRAESGAFEQAPATVRRRAGLVLGRGRHTLQIVLDAATVDRVGVRIRFSEKRLTKQSWTSVPLFGGRGVTLQTGDTQTPYRLLKADETVRLTVTGPRLVRVLTRPMGTYEPTYTLNVTENRKPYRSIRLPVKKSRKARLRGDSKARPGVVREVVFPVGKGSHTFRINASSHQLLRVQAADDPMPPQPDGTRSWKVQGRVAAYYDDNILRYSDKFIQRFENGQDPDRFKVTSLDDTIYRADLYVDRHFAGLGRRPATVRFSLEHRAYQENNIKDWSRFGLAWSQKLRGNGILTLTGNSTTDFYVRHLRDGDLTGRQGVDPFQAFRFRKTQAVLDYAHKAGVSSDLRYHLGTARMDHSDAFREFDSNDLFAGLRHNLLVGKTWRLSYGLEYMDSSARGYDGPGETLETSDDTDPSYRQYDLMLAARWKPRKRQTFFLQLETGRREYTTDKSPDTAPLHAGRKDRLGRAYMSWQYDFSRLYRLAVFVQARERSSDAPIDLDIGAEKDYEQMEAGIRFSIRFDSR